MIVYPERFVDLSLYQSGEEDCTPGQSVGPGTYDHYLFCFVKSGRGALNADQPDGTTRNFLVETGEGFLLWPGQPAMYIADMDDPWSRIWLEFDGLCVPEFLQHTSLTRDSPLYKAKDEGAAREMKREMLEIVEHPEASPLFVTAHLYAFAGYLQQSAPGTRRSKELGMRARYIRTALDYIAENYNRKIRIEDIAAECGIDRSYFGKLFHQVLGQSPQSFLLEYRMVRARTLLQETDMSVAAVGAAVGYENALHFSRAFRNKCGMPPREWRIRNRRSLYGC